MGVEFLDITEPEIENPVFEQELVLQMDLVLDVVGVDPEGGDGELEDVEVVEY